MKALFSLLVALRHVRKCTWRRYAVYKCEKRLSHFYALRVIGLAVTNDKQLTVANHLSTLDF